MIDPNSPLLTLPVLDTALKGAADPVVRLQILAARVQVLQRDNRAPAAGSDNAPTTTDPTPLLAARLDLADAYLATTPADHHSAGAEASVVEVDCKRIQQRAERVRGGELEDLMDTITALRKRAVLLLARIDGDLGRKSRAERWRKLAEEL
jgi:hypothetical protein